MRRRCELLEAANRDKGLQAHINALCAIDPIRWFNDWAWTFDPRRPAGQRVVPFVLMPFQVEYLLGLRFCLKHKIRSITPKSRDMGVTWLNGGFDAHQVVYETGYKAAFGSRKEDLLDRTGDADCIFWKLRFLLDRLPGWMLPSYESAHMRIFNPSKDSAITGEAGDNIGRGGRNSRYTVDESAFLKNPKAVDASLSENTDCRNDTSTVNGPGNPFAEAMERDDAVPWTGEDSTPTDAVLIKFVLHWRLHPEKTEEWYEAKKASIGDPMIVAKELDIDINASVTGVVVPRGWVTPCIGRALYQNERGAICIGGDVGEKGADASSAVVREGLNIHHAEEWHGEDPAQSALRYIALGLEWEKKLGSGHKLYFFIDRIGIGSGVVANLFAYINDPKNGKQGRWFVVPVQANETAPKNEPECFRLKDVLWWRMREAFQPDDGKRLPAISAAIPRQVANKLATELGSPTYTISDGGLIVVEPKRVMAKRGVKSPNLGDALMHTYFWEAMKPAELTDAEKLMEQYNKKEGGTWMSRR